MKKKISNKELMVRILVTMEELVGKLKTEGKNLDEYQKLQVVQALVVAKAKLVELVGKVEGKDLVKLEPRMEEIERELKELMVRLDYEKVKEILETLSLGLAKLVEKAKKEGKVK